MMLFIVRKKNKSMRSIAKNGHNKIVTAANVHFWMKSLRDTAFFFVGFGGIVVLKKLFVAVCFASKPVN